MKKRMKSKSREKMLEIADIVKNSETDEAALEFLKDALEDDFPDLDLGRMDLHEASEVLSRKNDGVIKGRKASENLNSALEGFMKKKKSSDKKKVANSKKKRKRGRRK